MSTKEATRKNSMKCPHCNHAPTKVIGTRRTVNGIRRTRLCPHCEKTFFTIEVIEAGEIVQANGALDVDALRQVLTTALDVIRRGGD